MLLLIKKKLYIDTHIHIHIHTYNKSVNYLKCFLNFVYVGDVYAQGKTKF